MLPLFPSRSRREFGYLFASFRTQILCPNYTTYFPPFAAKGDGMGVFMTFPPFRGQFSACGGLNDAESVLHGVFRVS